jgi:LysM repeat protein
MEDFGNTINLKNNNIIPNKRRKVEGVFGKQKDEMSRRDLIKRAVKAGLGASVLGIAGKSLIEILKEKAVWENLEKRSEEIKKGHQKEKEIEQKEKEIKVTPEQEEIRQEDSRIIGKTIEEQLLTQDQVVLNMETKNALQQKWKESYSPKPENYSGENQEFGRNFPGLEKAMKKMQPWLSLMKEEFQKVGVPEKFVYLAIPESHFDLNAFSRAYAKGPYQFIESSARAYGLKIDEKVDFRCDPIESARACAQHLKDSYERFNNDWDLTFADYNGGFTNKYAQFRVNKKDRNYEDYLNWREGRLNDYLRKKKKGEYSVKKGDTLFGIAKKFGISVDKIKAENNLTGDVIKLGQKLKIEGKTFDINDLGDSLENLNYPEKFYAILEVIEEQGLEEKFPAEKLKFDLMEVPRVDFTEDSYVVRKGNTLFGIARSLKNKLIKEGLDLGYSVGSLMDLIIRQNGIKKDGTIHPGQKLILKIPVSESPSLTSMAKNLGIDLKKLQALNPAIRNLELALPSGYQIRVPK